MIKIEGKSSVLVLIVLVLIVLNLGMFAGMAQQKETTAFLSTKENDFASLTPDIAITNYNDSEFYSSESPFAVHYYVYGRDIEVNNVVEYAHGDDNYPLHDTEFSMCIVRVDRLTFLNGEIAYFIYQHGCELEYVQSVSEYGKVWDF